MRRRNGKRKKVGKDGKEGVNGEEEKGKGKEEL
jgi:hypothetical protein